MARRSVWLVTGVVAGAASSLYAERKLRRTLEVAAARLQPDSVVAGVGRTVRQAAVSTTGRVRDAVASGRTEMQRREEEIWAGLDSSPVSQTSDGRKTVSANEAPPANKTALETESARPVRMRGRRQSRRSPSHLGK